jgi:hypothetical protein
MINLIQSPSTHMPTEEYSHMMVEMKLMVDGDEGSEYGGEGGL